MELPLVKKKRSDVNHLSGESYETKAYFKGFKRSLFLICDWWISIRFLSFCVSRFVPCDLLVTKNQTFIFHIFLIDFMAGRQTSKSP